MMILVTGGSASGKSEYAEESAIRLAGDAPKYYIATMKQEPYNMARIRKHRDSREGKGFITIEEDMELGRITVESHATYLIEDIPNLLANHMFTISDSENNTQTDEININPGDIIQRIITDISRLRDSSGNLVIVTGDISRDGMDYGESTLDYIERLGYLNRKLAEMADIVVKTVVGIPICIKGSLNDGTPFVTYKET